MFNQHHNIDIIYVFKFIISYYALHTYTNIHGDGNFILMMREDCCVFGLFTILAFVGCAERAFRFFAVKV